MPEKKTKQITPLSELPFSNNFMFAAVMRKMPVCRLFLETLLGKKIAEIRYSGKEQEFSDHPSYHGIRFDVYVEGEDRTRYDIEMQRVNQDQLERRVRYYQSTLDRDALAKNAKYRELPESYIIFVCDFDYFKSGLAQYTRVSTLKDSDVEYDDGSHVIFLNSHYATGNAGKEILAFLDFVREGESCEVEDSAIVDVLRDAMQEVRSDKREELCYMLWAQDLEDYREEAREEGGHIVFRDIVKRMLDKGLDIATIVSLTGHHEDEVRAAIREINQTEQK